MKSALLRYCCALVVVLIGLLIGKDSWSLDQPPDAGSPAQKQLTEVIELPRQKLIFKPSRDDITVGCALFSLHTTWNQEIRPDAIRVNGVQPKRPILYLQQVDKNSFELPALKIEYSSEELGGPLYLTVKAWFNELYQYDSPYYEHVPDRYALLSYCTKEDEDPSKVNARLGANRVRTLTEFKERLEKPFVIKLNQRPLREEWNRYALRPLPGDLSAADAKAVENLVREQGEQYVISISAADADNASVNVGNGSLFLKARAYKVVRNDGKWRIEGVENIEDYSWFGLPRPRLGD